MGAEQSVPEPQNFSLIIANALFANILLNEAEKEDNYRKKIAESAMDAKARSTHDYFPLADSQVDKQELQVWLNNFVEVDLAKQNFFKFLMTQDEFRYTPIKIYIINLQFSADAGMPHTRPLPGNVGLICIPGGLRGAEWEKRILIREIVHIFQRLFDKFWLRVYKKYLHMEPYLGAIPEKYLKALRHNPNTLPMNFEVTNTVFLFSRSIRENVQNSMVYKYKEKWVPLCIFNDITNPDMGSTRIVYLNAENGIVYDELPSELVNDDIFDDSRITSTMREHPNELVAWVLAEPERFSDTSVYEISDLFATIK
jgi:hypothetical protein